jgi:hypothetical protein
VKTITASVAVLLATTSAALAADEIQIYNAQIAAVGQWTIEQHLNYTIDGRKQPDFPGGLVPNHAQVQRFASSSSRRMPPSEISFTA